MFSNILGFINHKRKSIIKTIVIFLIILVIFNLLLLIFKDTCTEINSVETFLEVKNDLKQVVGINADIDGLKFGKISASSGVRRSITVNSVFDAEVDVFIDAPFASWVTIEPTIFAIKKNQTMEVSFDVLVPDNSPNGNYSGKVYFCFKRS
nr:hypothetical protein [uncultured archaeon]